MPRGTPNTETSDDFPTKGIDSITADDPDAMVIGSINGPKSVPGRVSFVLTSESKTLIVIQRASGNFKIYQELPAPLTATNVSQLPKAGSAA